jgi:hypothetical protein
MTQITITNEQAQAKQGGTLSVDLDVKASESQIYRTAIQKLRMPPKNKGKQKAKRLGKAKTSKQKAKQRKRACVADVRMTSTPVAADVVASSTRTSLKELVALSAARHQACFSRAITWAHCIIMGKAEEVAAERLSTAVPSVEDVLADKVSSRKHLRMIICTNISFIISIAMNRNSKNKWPGLVS